MALSVVNNMTAFGTGDTGESIDVGTGAGWYDMDNLHADFGRLSLINSITADYYEGQSGVEGCVGISHATSATVIGMVYSDGSTTIDMSGTMFIRCTAKFGETSKMGTKAQGGIRLIVVDSGGDYKEWYVGGVDDYSGDWEQFLVDVSTTADNTSATAPTMTDITYIGISSYYVTKPARAENVYIDAQWYGSDPSITITGTATTSGDCWSELESLSQSVTRRDGVIRLRNGIYELRGGMKFNLTGGSGSVDFSDNQNSKLLWSPAPAGSLDSASFISVEGNATGTTDFTLGSLVGTGDDRQGYIGGLIGSLGPRATFDSKTDTANIDSMELYGVTMENLGTVAFDGATTQEAITCTYLGSYQVDPGAAEVLSCFFVNTADTDAALLWNESIDISYCQFIANTVGAAVEHPSAVGSPYTHTNLVYSGNTFDVLNSSGSAISISKTGTSNPTTSEGSAVTYIGASVTVKATATTTAGVGIENALVLVKAVSMSPEGPFPVSESVTIARTGSPVDLAVVSHTAHGMQANDKVVIEGATQAEYNGVKTISYIDANSYSFVCSSSPLPVTPATGTITATFAALYGLTDANGEVSTSRVYNSPQDVSGWSRKMSGTPYYKEGVLTGTVSTTTGFDRSAVMALDE